MSLKRVGGAGDEGIDLTGWWFVPSHLQHHRRYLNESDKSLNVLPGIDGNSKKAGITEGVKRLKVIGQCKAEAKPLNGRAVRELEGVMAHLYGTVNQTPLMHRYSISQHRPGRSLFQTPSDLSIYIGDSKHDNEPEAQFPALSILSSQSGFSAAATTRALRSPTPMLLLHLPGGRPVEESDEEGEENMIVNGAFMNPALGAHNGLLGGLLDLRREELDGGGCRYRFWYDGRPIPRRGAHDFDVSR